MTKKNAQDIESTMVSLQRQAATYRAEIFSDISTYSKPSHFVCEDNLFQRLEYTLDTSNQKTWNSREIPVNRCKMPVLMEIFKVVVQGDVGKSIKVGILDVKQAFVAIKENTDKSNSTTSGATSMQVSPYTNKGTVDYGR